MKKLFAMTAICLATTACVPVEAPLKLLNGISGGRMDLTPSAEGAFETQISGNENFCNGIAQNFAGLATLGIYDATMNTLYNQELDDIFSQGNIIKNHCTISYFYQDGHLSLLSDLSENEIEYKKVVTNINLCAIESKTAYELEKCWSDITHN